MHLTEEVERIRELNDDFRTTFDQSKGRIMFTAGVAALPLDVKAVLIRKVATFNDFSRDNDPYGEHDFCVVDVSGQKFFAKIDYYASDMCRGSEDPSDAKQTVRVLTIMLASEY